MMHYAPTDALAVETDADARRHADHFAALEMSAIAFRKAKRQADISLRQLQAAPLPHTAANALFVDLLIAHRRDREALFEAMRRLDAARSALRALAVHFPNPLNQNP